MVAVAARTFLEFIRQSIDEEPTREQHFTTFTEGLLGLRFQRIELDDPNDMWDHLAETQAAAVGQRMAVDKRECDVVVLVNPLLPMQIHIRHPTGDWEQAINEETPWLLASTAGALRSFYTKGKRAPVKQAADRRLFNMPGRGEAPDVDEHGNL